MFFIKKSLTCIISFFVFRYIKMSEIVRNGPLSHSYKAGDKCLAKRRDGSYTPAHVLLADNINGLYKVVFKDELKREFSEKTIGIDEIMPFSNEVQTESVEHFQENAYSWFSISKFFK
jgi:hypothetical protein